MSKKSVVLVAIWAFLLAGVAAFGLLMWKHAGEPEPSPSRMLIRETPQETTTPSAEAKPEVTETEMSLSADEQFEANIFLSNFAEIYTDSLVPQTASVTELVDFAFATDYLNTRDRPSEQLNGAYFTTLTLDQVNAILDRFFGRTLSQSEAQQYTDSTSPNGERYFLSGKFYATMADGATIAHVAIVDHLYKRSDGTYRAEFTIYGARERESIDTGSREVYSMTPDQAASTSFFDGVEGKGAAVMTPNEYKGRHSYHLVSYSRFE